MQSTRSNHYKGANDLLWSLYRLNNIEKHGAHMSAMSADFIKDVTRSSTWSYTGAVTSWVVSSCRHLSFASRESAVSGRQRASSTADGYIRLNSAKINATCRSQSSSVGNLCRTLDAHRGGLSIIGVSQTTHAPSPPEAVAPEASQANATSDVFRARRIITSGILTITWNEAGPDAPAER
jgi:hypothetical protein